MQGLLVILSSGMLGKNVVKVPVKKPTYLSVTQESKYRKIFDMKKESEKMWRGQIE